MSATRVLKLLLLFFVLSLLVAGFKGLDIYHKAFTPNIQVKDSRETYFYVYTGSSFAEVFGLLKKKNLLKNEKTFEWTAHKKKYPDHIQPGRYLVKNRMSNNELVNLLRSGRQEPVMLTFNNTNTLKNLADRVAVQLEFRSDSLLKQMADTSVLNRYDFTLQTLPAMFIPNTYEIYWNTSPEQFMDRMYREYNRFWTRLRQAKADKLNLTRVEVITLASIVTKETSFDNEKPRVAGLYINRLEKGIRLQADPTLIFAWGDYSIRRVLNYHRQLDSPYNTYMYDGLPPGPICIPDIASIDAVLNYERHNYIYMCAKPDFSGYHNFAATLDAHNRNAEAYRRELNKRKIYN